MQADDPVGWSVEPKLDPQSLSASALCGQGAKGNVGGSIAKAMEEVPAAEAKKSRRCQRGGYTPYTQPSHVDGQRRLDPA
jgi:hypothetical protein